MQKKSLNMFLECKMIPSICQPIRVTPRSATLIDNMYINSQLSFPSHMLTDDLSDHFPCLVSYELPLRGIWQVQDQQYFHIDNPQTVYT